MKKILKYIGAILTVSLIASVTSCNIEEVVEPSDIGLGLKVFFPTKVVTGQPMTINGSGFLDATEVVFPQNVVVTDFEIVSNDMIRITAPAGIAAEGGKIIVRTKDNEVESRLPLTIGSTSVSGFSKQDGESISGGEQLTIYGEDLEFISAVELLDADGNPQVIEDEGFYRKGTSSVVIIIPKTNIFDGTFVGKVYTFDGRTFDMPELTYSPASTGGHWETVKTSVWKNDGSHGAVSWSGDYRFAPEFNLSGEEIASIPADIWTKMKTDTFYILLESTNPQIRLTTGWWSTSWTADDIFPGNELLTDNGDGTFTLAVTLAGSALADAIDVEHFLITGDRFTPLEIYFSEDVWIEGSGHFEKIRTSFWKNETGEAIPSWGGKFRFGMNGRDGGNECVATFDEATWNILKTQPFRIAIEKTVDYPNVRVTTGWWSTDYLGKEYNCFELVQEDENGNLFIEIDLSTADDLLAVLDEQHLLFTGDGYKLLEIYQEAEVWVEEGGDDGPKQVVFWENDGSHGEISWDSNYRFALDGNDTQNECLTTFPAEVWNVIKTGTFYLEAMGSSWVQMRITDGWWQATWTGNDITTGSELIEDLGDGKYRIAINFQGDPLLDLLDAQHLLFTGGGYTPLKLYYEE